MTEGDIAGLAIVCIFGLPVVGWIVIRFMQYSERMAMIKRGIVPPANERGWRNAAPPQSGAVPPPAGAGYLRYPQAQLGRGIMTALIGLALLIGLSFIGVGPNGSWIPGPWLIGGLIPLFVGIAQIISAIVQGAELPQGRTFVPPPGPHFDQPSPPPPQTGPYAYRPPGDQGELPRTKPPQNL